MTTIMCYQQARDYLGSKNERPLPGRMGSTRIRRVADSKIEITLHGTAVVTYEADGRIVLNSGGWRTKTTKERMNQYGPEGFYVSQDRGVWYLNHGRRQYVYTDQIAVDSDGRVYGEGERDDVKRAESDTKRIKAYTAAYMRELMAGNVPAPSGGDCWFCYLRSEEGEPLGDTVGDAHVREHLEESYFVPSLLVNAVHAFPISIMATGALTGIWNMDGRTSPLHDFERKILIEQAGSSLCRYLKRQLGIAA